MSSRSSTVKLAAGVLIALAAAYGGAMSVAPSKDEGLEPSPDAQGGGAVFGTVDHVADGDTLTVRRSDGRTERVRLIGIDTPELSDTRTGSAQCGGPEARDELERWAGPGTRVRFEADPGQDARDRFGRLLGYVTPADDPSVPTLQERQLVAGWARVYVYARDPFDRVGEFRGYAAEARTARRGVWARCGGRFDRPAR